MDGYSKLDLEVAVYGILNKKWEKYEGTEREFRDDCHKELKNIFIGSFIDKQVDKFFSDDDIEDDDDYYDYEDEEEDD